MIKMLMLFLVFMHNVVIADIVVSAKSVNESYSKNVEVSGEYLVGVQLLTNDALKSLHVMFPENSKGMLCVKLSSIDGKYKATLKHKIKETVSGATRIEFDSEYRNIMKNYNSKEIAISASLRDSCDSHVITKQLVSSWGKNVTSDLVILIRSSARKDVVYVPNKREYKIKSKCKKFRKSYNVSYDKFCLLKGVDLAILNEIEIVRKNLQRIKPEKITIN